MYSVRCPDCKKAVKVPDHHTQPIIRCLACGYKIKLGANSPDNDEEEEEEVRPPQRPRRKAVPDSASGKKKGPPLRYFLMWIGLPVGVVLLPLAPFTSLASWGAIYLGGALAALGAINAFIIFQKKGLTDLNETSPWYMRGGLLTIISQIAYARQFPRTLGVWVTLELGGLFIVLTAALIHGLCKPPAIPRWFDSPRVPLAGNNPPPFQNNPRPANNQGNPDKGNQNPLPVSTILPDGPPRFLVDFQSFDPKPGPWPIKKGEGGDGNPIRVGTMVSPHGLGMHPPVAPGSASIKYHLNRKAEVFMAIAGINHTTSTCFSPAIFTVGGDGKELWRSGEINIGRPQECVVDVRGVDILELRTQCGGLNTGVHAVWVEPRVYEKSVPRDPK